MKTRTAPASHEIRIGISACLTGEAVRYDGQHKLDPFVSQTVGQLVRWVPVCPEVELGLGVPRETIRLEALDEHPEAVRLVAPGSGTDHTRAMKRYARRRVRALAACEIDGFVVKKGSPSCGMARVPVHRDGGRPPRRQGRGFFARELMRSLPTLPVEEEGRLHDPGLRESFFVRVFAHHRLRRLFVGRWRKEDLVRLHDAERLLLLAHHRDAHGTLGRLVAQLGQRPPAEIAAAYRATMMAALTRIATPRRHASVLKHVAGQLKPLLDAGDLEELATTIDDLGRGQAPLLVPLTLIRHHVRRHGLDHLARQSYLAPHPTELLLRNHA
jgi:uncharacterized protein YbbK (DUF523 family)/uncharacterized protein YbgA (DUF1722 family)